MKVGVEPHLKTLPKDVQKDDVALGIEAVLSELERSVSTAAFTRYAIAVDVSFCRKGQGEITYDQWYA